MISVSTNYRIHEEEIQLIDDCIYKGKTIKNLKEAYSSPIQSMEGRGLGFIIIMLFLRNVGLTTKSFGMKVTDDSTRFQITVPYNLIAQEKEEQIAEEIVKEVNEIPMIPDYINELKKKLNDPEASLGAIEKIILRDPSLTADIMRIANSSFYMLPNPINSLKDGVKIIGTRGISNIILVSSCYHMMKDKMHRDKIQEIIKHSEQTAFFARQLIELKNLNIDIDDIYLASLLHDIGKIVVEGINPDIYESIQNTIDEKDLPVELLEDLSGGLYHAQVGSLIAQNWRFPEMISQVIRYHHDPRSAEAYADSVFLVYLANALTYFINGKIAYHNIDENVLEFFELSGEEIIVEFADKLKNAYKLYHNIDKM